MTLPNLSTLSLSVGAPAERPQSEQDEMRHFYNLREEDEDQHGRRVYHYALPRVNEHDRRLTHIERGDGSTDYYDQWGERKVRTEWPEGWVQYYEGPAADERKVRTERPNGEVIYFEGDQGRERQVRIEFPNGDVQHWEYDKVDPERGISVSYTHLTLPTIYSV